jgi:hypothetical protein
VRLGNRQVGSGRGISRIDSCQEQEQQEPPKERIGWLGKVRPTRDPGESLFRLCRLLDASLGCLARTRSLLDKRNGRRRHRSHEYCPCSYHQDCDMRFSKRQTMPPLPLPLPNRRIHSERRHHHH